MYLVCLLPAKDSEITNSFKGEIAIMSNPTQEQIEGIAKIIKKRLGLHSVEFQSYSYPSILFKVVDARGKSGEIKVNNSTGRVFELYHGVWRSIHIQLT